MGGTDAIMRKANRDRAPAEVLMEFSEGVDASDAPVEIYVFMGPRRIVGGGNRNLEDGTERMFGDGSSIHRQGVALVNHARIKPEIFGRAVVIEKTVVFPFDVVQLCENIG